MKNNRINRRQFIKQSGKAVAAAALMDGPISMLMDAITQGAIARAYAESTGSNPRNWVDMRFYGAPPRWVYDLVLKTSAADDANFVPGPAGSQFANKYVPNGSGRYTSAVYSTVKIGDMRMPHLWTAQVPSPGGHSRPMSDLLANFLCIRGIDTGSPGHIGSETLHYRPRGSSKSLPALVADASTSPIAAAYTNSPNFNFFSTASKGPLILTGNFLTALTSPFQPSSSVTTVRQREQLINSYVRASRDALNARALARHPDAALIKSSVNSAQSMMSRALTSMNTQYAALQAKYTDLITRSLATTVAGINDFPIGSVASAGSPRDFRHRVNSRIVEAADIRSLVNPQRNPSPTAIPSMANSFAIAEFILLNGFSQSVSVNLNEMTNLLDGTTKSGYAFDEHVTGVLCSIYINSMYYLAHAACMLEFIDRMRAANIWNDTVVAVGSEFNRSPKNDGSGADHGFRGASLQLYSGCIPGPMVLGNIAQDASPTIYKGSWGSGALVPELSLPTDLGHMINTVASIVRVPPPVSARQGFVDGSGNTAVATVPTGKIVV
jgi:hypothetical protein